MAPLTLEYSTPRERRRVRFEPIDGADHFMRIVDIYKRGRWRPVGREPVEDLCVQTPEETVIAPGASTTSGP